jgi:hypothetical protein
LTDAVSSFSRETQASAADERRIRDDVIVFRKGSARAIPLFLFSRETQASAADER